MIFIKILNLKIIIIISLNISHGDGLSSINPEKLDTSIPFHKFV
jgi:hypothetical protein